MENLNKTSDKIVLKFSLPFFDLKDIKVDLKDESILIEAHKIDESENEREGFLQTEITNQDFSYFSNLPPVNTKDYEVDFSEGILKITLKKK